MVELSAVPSFTQIDPNVVINGPNGVAIWLIEFAVVMP
jgi:hypothetical protein